MAIKKQDWDISERGLRDAARHREKVRESIRKNIADIISDTAIITRKKGQIVKVPIRGLKSYRFVFRRESSGGTGIGQGKGAKGDVIGRQPIRDGQSRQPGDQPGVDFLETEIDIEELIGMMLEDLGLPNLKSKAFTETESPKGWKYDSIERTGIIAHLDKKRTLREAVRRTAGFVGELMRKTGRPEEDCKKALTIARGDLLRAEKILRKGNLEEKVEEFTPLFSEDLRYRTLEKDVEYHSNAVVLAMMDVSGSMGTAKKYLARSFFFWLVEFLKQIYSNVQIRFIAHTTEAKLVDEHEFFHKGESGGTFCHSAYDLAIYLVETEYNPSRWNVYAFHFSDGEDFERVLEMVRGVAALDLEVCCTLGMLTEIQAVRLKEAGLTAYNHNLDTSPEFYGNVITTRVYEDRLQTIAHLRKAGITVCCGGILGMGESDEDRISLLEQLSHLDPHPESVPINMLVANEGTPLADAGELDPLIMVRAIATARILMPASRVRLAAGRAKLVDQDLGRPAVPVADQRLLGDLPELAPAGQPVGPHAGDHVVQDGHGERIRPLEEHAHLAPQRHGVRPGLPDAVPVQQHIPGVPVAGDLVVHPVECAQQRGLARARRSQQSGHDARPDVQ